MRTVKEVAQLTGVSVRALHHYDAIGLLPPTTVTEAGYRLYDASALARLQQICFFRELRFSLKDIKEILDSPDYNPMEALAQQIVLLEMEYARLGRIIAFAKTCQEKGDFVMENKPFDRESIAQYKEEVRARWGDTAAYQEFKEREKMSSGFQQKEFFALFKALGALRAHLPEDACVQEKIDALQQFISAHFYTCTDDVLSALGKLYVNDERFQKNIDAVGGEGTAVFVSQAIAARMKNK